MKGGRSYPTWLLKGFHEVIEDCELIDMELHGYPYTYDRGYGTTKWIEIRLDRALVKNSWGEIFTEAKLTNIEISTSDQCPIISKLRKFRFENAWLREPMYRKIS